MNLELNGYKITLGPKALAHVETAYRAKGEYLDQCAAIYCRDQLELWRAGGKCDPDVTVTGPARFVAKGNAIGIPMMPKAGVAPASVAECKTGSKEPLPVASAAPAGEWPKCWRYCVGSGYDTWLYDGATWWHKSAVSPEWSSTRFPRQWNPDFFAGRLDFPRYPEGEQDWLATRQPAKDTGLQVWRSADRCIWIFDGNGVSLAWLGVSGSWYKARIGRVRPSDALVTGPAADAAIKEARAQGVI